MMNSSGKRSFGLDVIRCFAIAPVLLIHYVSFAFESFSTFFAVFGMLGVELFFALSGFLIGGIIIRDFSERITCRGIANFYARRWMRTLPLYWTFFLVTAFVTTAGLRLDPAWTGDCWLYLVFLQNLAWPPLVAWFHESWSLAIEEWFYITFPLLVAILPGRGGRLRIFGAAILLAVIPPALRLIFFDPGRDFDGLRKIVVFRLDAIAWGILAALASTAWPGLVARARHLIGALGLAGLVLTVAVLSSKLTVSTRFIHTALFTLAPIALAAIVLWARHADWARLVPNRASAFIYWGSTRSYAIYLCHGSVVKTMLHHSLFAKGPALSAIMFFGTSFVIADLVHRAIERPIMRLRPTEIRNGIPSLGPVGV